MTEALIHPFEDLIADLIDFSGAPEYRLFYVKKINELGPGLVREAFAEVRSRYLQGLVDDPGRYLTIVLQDFGKQYGKSTHLNGQMPLPSVQADSTPGLFAPMPFVQVPFAQGLRSVAIPENLKNDSQFLSIPFAKNYLQWVLDLNNKFFALNNETADWDQVTTSVTLGSKRYNVKMLRGKLDEDDRARGILTVEHMRVLLAVSRIWADRRGPYQPNESNTARFCHVSVTTREVAQYMGVHIGSNVVKYITQKILDLANTGYCFVTKDTPEAKADGIQDFSFQFFGEVQKMTRKEKNGTKERYFNIYFSEAYSRLLLDRKVVSRPIDLLTIRKDIAFKLYVYLYPILIQQKPEYEHRIELKKLIEALELKLVGWHQYASQRKREFEKAVKEVNGRPTTDGRVFRVYMEDTIDERDFILCAKFVEPEE